jgi:putative intracellular protease/amidase
MRSVGVLVYENFELLDLFGPLEMLGWLGSEFDIKLIASAKGPVASNMGPATIANLSFDERKDFDVLLIPGGWGRNIPVDTALMVPWLTEAAQKAEMVLTVCTGSALLALTGHLDGRKATSNKALFNWVAEKRPTVLWQPIARWVQDGKFFTSSGVSAGMDMSLAAIGQMLGAEKAEEIARGCEYQWHKDPDWDPFSEIHRHG